MGAQRTLFSSSYLRQYRYLTSLYYRCVKWMEISYNGVVGVAGWLSGFCCIFFNCGGGGDRKEGGWLPLCYFSGWVFLLWLFSGLFGWLFGCCFFAGKGGGALLFFVLFFVFCFVLFFFTFRFLFYFGILCQNLLFAFFLFVCFCLFVCLFEFFLVVFGGFVRIILFFSSHQNYTTTTVVEILDNFLSTFFLL